MTETETHDQLRRLLAGAAEAHHSVDEGHDHDWAQWYAAYLIEDVLALSESKPSLETLTTWLREADVRSAREGVDADWPSDYATWILEWDRTAAS